MHIEIILLLTSQTLTEMLKIATERKKLKAMGNIALFMNHYPRNG